jgi:hypothetical protein
VCPVKDKHAAEFQYLHGTAALDRRRRTVAGHQPEPVQHLDQEFLFGDIGDRRAGRKNRARGARAIPRRRPGFAREHGASMANRSNGRGNDSS